MVGVMQPSKEQIDALNANLVRVGFKGCPCCGSKNMQFNRIVAAPNVPTPNSKEPQTYTPLALLLCRECYGTMQYAWLPIEATIKGPGSSTGIVARILGAARDLIG